MLYTYNKKELLHKRVSLVTLLKIVAFIALTMIVIAVRSYQIGITKGFSGLSDVEKAVVIKKTDEFERQKLVQMLKDLNVKFPHIVLAQSMQETGNWKSAIFLENNNLFGMKEARSRITTAEGTNRNHAYYNHWRESVYDYAFYQCRYLNGIRSEAEYYQYLSASYAEDPTYVQRVQSLVENKGLKNLFQ